MATNQTPPALRPFHGENIPDLLKTQSRWAPWKAVWSEKRGKYDKIPCNLNAYGISTARPERWFSYDLALAAYLADTDAFAGVGYVMTGPHDLVGVDLDHCVENNTIAPWAQQTIDRLASYTELSPSGTGLRIFIQGEIPNDWTNHEVGVEVYSGHEPRFLTVTGNRLKQSPTSISPANDQALAELSASYMKDRTTADIISLSMPDIIDELLLPGVATLDIPYAAKDFLLDGKHRGDRSRELFATSVALYVAGLSDEEVFSYLVGSPHVFEMALEHRRQDSDRAMMYLWVEHCQKAKARAATKSGPLDGFEDLSSPANPETSPEFVRNLSGSAISGMAAAPAARFVFEQAAEFSHGKPATWSIKGVLPQAEMGVVYGESGSGKSFFVLDMLMAIACGTSWRGKKVKQGPVAYICAEGAGGFRTRLTAYAQHNGIDLATIPFYILGDAPNLMEKADVKDVLLALQALPGIPAVIAVDTWAQVTAGANENSGEDMGRALGHCKAMHRITQAMILLVAHSGKDASRGMRGWSGVKGALDVEILIEQAGEYKAATITKMKDGTGEGDEFAFKLNTVVLGQDEDGDDITSCVLEQTATEAKPQQKKPPAGIWPPLVWRVAQDLADMGDAPTTSQLIESSINQMPHEEGTKDRRRELVMRAIETLVATGRISAVGGLVVVL